MQIDWKIVYVSNEYTCEVCGKKEQHYVDYICNAYTSGLQENYGHQEIRIILDMGPQEIARILNTIGMRIRDGETFKPGDMISGIYLDCDLRVDSIDEEDDTISALRLIIPDSKNRFPEDELCDEIYALQKYKLKDLVRHIN